MSKVIRFVVVIGLFANQFLAPLQVAQTAGPQQPDQVELHRIADMVSKLDELAYFEELGEPMPFTTVSPSDERALRLGGLFDDLAERIAALSNSSDDYDYGDVSVQFSLQPVNDEFRLSFTASRVITAPVTLSLEDPASATPGLCNDGIDNNSAEPDGADQDDTDCSYIGTFLNGGGIKTSLAVSGDFLFTQEDPDVVMAPESVITLSVESTANDIVPFADQFGFADIMVGGQAMLDEVVAVAFNDPDGDGRITGNEWFDTAVEDLTAVTFEPGSSAVYSLILEPEVPGLVEPGVINLNVDRSARPEWPGETTIFIPESLRVFANIDSDKALAGLNSYAVSLNTALIAGEAQLPFLDMRFSDAFMPGQPILELIKQQTDALVICGKTDTLPPTGDPASANPLYCQAITHAEPAEVVSWTLENADLDYSGPMTRTVGISPKENVKFDRSSLDQRPRARVEFIDADGESHVAYPRVLSANELSDELSRMIDSIESGSGQVTLRYLPERSALMYDMTMRSSPPVTTTDFAFADQLRQETNLANLESAAAVDPQVGFTNVVLSSTFGILLADTVPSPPGEIVSSNDEQPDPCADEVDNDQDGLMDGYDPDCPAPNGPEDRFFIVPSGSPAITVEDLILTDAESVSLSGNIGFLGVSAEGPFALERGDVDENLLEIELLASKNVTDYAGIEGAIRIREFLADQGSSNRDGQVRTAANINMTADLAVQSIGLSEELTGNVGIEWDLSATDSPTITVDTDFANNLRPFDIAPSLAGYHTPAMTHMVASTFLIDASRNFVEDFGGGIKSGDVLDLELLNLTDGSGCASFQVEPHKLSCVVGYTQTLPITGTLAGGERNYWAPGDEYEIQGDPQALGNLILDSLIGLSSQMQGLDLNNPAKAEYASTLPLIGLSPRDLVTQFDALVAASGDIRSGSGDAEIVCEPAVENDSQPGNLFCRAFTDLLDIKDAQWSLSAGHGVFTETVPSTSTVGVSPDQFTAFSISVPEAEREAFQITLVFTDTNDTSYAAIYPPKPINRLSDLKNGLTSYLTRQYGPAAVGVSFSSDYISNPTGNSEPVLHLVPHLEIEEQGFRPYRLQLDLGDAELIASDSDSKALSLGFLSRAQVDLAIPLASTISAYDVQVRDTTGLSMTITARDNKVDLQASLGAAEVQVGLGANLTGKHELETITGAHISSIGSSTILTANLDIEALGFITGTSTILTNTRNITTSKTATCTVAAIEQNVVTCHEALGDGHQWQDGDGFELTGPSTKRLHDTSVDFSDFKIRPGTVVTNTTKGAGCLVGSSAGNVLSCMQPLTEDAFWEQGDEYEVGGTGAIQMALSSTLALTETRSLSETASALAHTFSSPYQDVISATLTVIISDGVNSGQVLGLAYQLDDLPGGMPTGEFATLLQAVEEAPIDWTMLPLPLTLLDGVIEQNLDGQWWGFGVPLVGYDLAAGAEISVAEINEEVLGAINSEADSLVLETMQALCKNDVRADGVKFNVITDTLSSYSCTDFASSLTIIDDEVKDFEITFVISETDEVYKPAFGLGLPGLPVTAEDDQFVQANTTWALTVTFGLSQTVGPYLNAAADDELQITSTVTFDHDSYTPSCMDEHADLPTTLSSVYTNRGCLKATIGFLPGTLFDNNAAGSNLVLSTTMDLDANGGILTFGQLLERTGAVVTVGAQASVDVAFIADLDRTRTILPIAGTFHLGFDTGEMQDVADGIQPAWITQLSYEDVQMNAGSFFGSFVGPMVEDVQSFTKPLQPPIDALSAPVPVINDLSQALGQGPVSMLTMLETISRNDLTLLERLGGFISFVNNLPADSAGVWIGLGGGDASSDQGDGMTLVGESGSFSLDPKETLAPPCYEDEVEEWLEGKGGACEPDNSIKKNWEKVDKSKTKSGREVTKKWEASASASYTAGGITLPFLNDTNQIYGMLLGIDATLLRVDLGTVSAGAGFSYSYYTVFVTPIGPIPVEFIVGGDVSVTGRFALGYDTRGLRHALAGESFTGEALLDGIFIDDYDADGNEVPELSFSATFYAGAAVSIRIVKVGLDMGVTFTVNLDLNDPNPDGKMYIDEIMMWRFNPVCLFEFSGDLTFFLRMYVEVDLFFFTARAEWYPFRHTINLFNVKCEPPDPVLAQPANQEGEAVLQMNVGSNAGLRRIAGGANEKYTVRQLTVVGKGCSTHNGIHEYDEQHGPFKAGPATACSTTITETEFYSGTWVSVVFQGIKQSYFLPGTDVTSTVPIFADAGGGDDVIRLEPGSDENGNEVPFELDAIIHGGDGNDRITTGGGDDVIYGDAGDDVINAGRGDDTVRAGAGNDKVDTNIGDDYIEGGGGNDTLNGGPGFDALDGGEGNDRLTGGPGLPPDSNFDGELQDKSDILAGGDGDDLLEGDYGRNILFGDAPLGYTGTIVTFRDSLIADDTKLPDGFDKQGACLDPDESEAASGRDTLTGGNDDDLLFGGPNNDSLAGGTGDDYICGNGGHDLLDGRRGDDELYGGSGNDQLLGWSGHDLLVGGSGHDLLRGDTGHDALIGDLFEAGDLFQAGDVNSEGSDALVGGSDNDLMLGDSGWITFTYNLSVTNTATQQQVLSSIELAEISGTGTVSCSLRVKVISGTIDLNGDDIVNMDDAGFFEGYPVVNGQVNFDIDASATISVTDTGFVNGILIQNGLVDVNGDGVVDADADFKADDPDQDSGTVLGVAIAGSGNADCLFGEDGVDYLFGGPADDQLFAGAGSDYLEGNDGSDIMRGGQDPDTLYGDDSCTETGCIGAIHPTEATNPGNDLLFGDSGDDQMFGDGGDDTMRGGIGEDIMLGDNGHILHSTTATVERISTTVSANGGSDTIYGDDGHDIILAGVAGDEVYGGRGNDTILGDQGVVARLADPDHPNDIWSTDPEIGGFDFVHGNDGDDLIIGGTGLTPTLKLKVGDMLWGDEGQDIIVGDNAYIARDGADIVEEIRSTHPANGDRDTVKGGDQEDLIVGGYAGDWLDGNDQADTILGDNGRIVLLAGGGDLATSLDYVRSTYPTLGGSDIISGSLGADLAFGGTLSDTISGGEGPDILLGDHGEFNSAWPVEQNFRSIYTGSSYLGAGDLIHGDAGDDFILGQQGVDELYGDGGEDDLTGGHNVDGGADTRDHIFGGPEDDVMLGDNGTILRRPAAGGWQRLSGGNGFDMALRETTVSLLTTEGTYGDDCMYGDIGKENILVGSGHDDTSCDSSDEGMVGGGGHDDMYGQLGDDYMEGNQGEDAMVGDLGRITNAIEDGSREQVIRSRSPFLESTIYASGSLLRSVELFAFDEDQGGAGGNDIMLGGDQADSLHGGPGADLLNGDGDATSMVVDPEEAADNRDSLFGGDGADAIWGGRGDDHLFGGRGDDYLDILPRSEMTVGKKNDPMTLDADPVEWFIYASNDNYQGEDIVYGGWDQDAMQADVGGPGPTAGDRLLDWVGAYNVYYLCGGAYGEGRITRSLAPHVIEYLQQLAEADGAAGATGVPGSSGAQELAMVFAQDARSNSHPIHDDHPGHFTCELDQSAPIADSNRTVAGRLTGSTPAETQQPASGCTVPGDYATIQAAVDDPGCDLITLGAGTFTETVHIERSVAIYGQGPAATTVDGGGTDHVFNIQASTELDQSTAMTVTINGLAITNGDSGLYAESKNTNWDPGYGLAQLYVDVADCAVSGNSSSGIRAYPHDFGQTEIRISETTIDGNLGPGVSNLPGTYGNGTVKLVRSTVSHNSGEGIITLGCGHGLCNATLDVTSSTISGNTGSGINNGGVANVTNSTISGNVADYGGGIYSCGTTNLLYSTVTGNSAGDGGGLFIAGSDMPYGCRGRVVASNSIVANSATGGDCALHIDTGPWAANFADAGHNIVEDGSCIDAASSRSGDPLLGPLADNDGPTLTHALTSLSPAIDAGDDISCLEADQRGRLRPVDGDGDGTATCDIGSFEYPGSILYVTPIGDGDCSSWASACSLQDALGAVGDGDEIWVAKGIHTPGVDQGDSFWLRDGVAVYGGFSGVETTRTQRDWQANVTVLSGDLGGDDTTDANGVITDTARIVGANAYHVVGGQGLNKTAVLDGFTITGGTAIFSAWPGYAGGGMYNDNSHPTLVNLLFRGNLAGTYGGGMYNNASNPTLENIIFRDNLAGYTLPGVGYGGGMYNNFLSSPTVNHVTFLDNSATGYGGGMRNYYSSNPTLRSVTFDGNSAGLYAGGLGNNYECNPTLVDVSFTNNSAGLGGGLANQGSSGTTMANVMFSGNTADYGGGMLTEGVYDYSLVKMANTIFTGNHANNDGGAIENRGSILELSQVTLANNEASGAGGGLNVAATSLPVVRLQVFNSIFWGNTAAHGAQLFNASPASPVNLDHVLIQDGCPADVGCSWLKMVNPLFMDAEGPDGVAGTEDDDLRLQESSPAVDSGNNALVPVDELDLDQDGDTAEPVPLDILGLRRFYGDDVDMGACEWQMFYQFTPIVLR